MLGLPVAVGGNNTAAIGLKSGLLKAETISVSVSSDRDESNITVESGLFLGLSVLNINLDALFLVVNTINNTGVEHELHSLLLESCLEVLANFHIEEGANTFSVLYDSHFSTKTLVNRSKFETNNAAANNDHFLGNFSES